MALSRNDILNAVDRDTVAVDVPEWGGTVHIRMMTAGERDRWELFVAKNSEHTRASLAVFTLADETGAPLFTLEDVMSLSGKSCHVMDKLFEIAAKHNKLRKEDLDELEKKGS